MVITRASAQQNLDAFERQAAPAHASERRAAVCLVLVDGMGGADGPELLITLRASTLRAHAGQWALPGGRLDPGETVREAAVRELAEEVGLEVPQDAVLGELDDFVTRSGFRITPVVVWAVDVPFTPVLAEAEVASIHRLTMSSVSVEPRFVAIPQSDRPVLQLPMLGQLIHAPTGAIVHQFAEVVLHGRATRVADVEQPLFAWK